MTSYRDYRKHIDELPTEDGWLDYFSAGTKRVECEGKATTAEAREAAKAFVSALEAHASPEPNIFPTVEGGVQCEWVIEHWHAESEILPDGSWNGFSALNCLPGSDESSTVYPGPSAVDAAAKVDEELWWVVNKTRPW